MKHRFRTASYLLCSLTLLFAATGFIPASHADDGADGGYVIDNVNVIPMDSERVLEGQRVVIREGLIHALGSASELRIPGNVRVIDGSGGYLMPGLGEMHAHVPPHSAGEQQAADVLMLYVANGITQIRGMLGEPWHLELREAIATGDWLGPRLYTSGPSFNGRSVSSPQQAAQRVREQAGAGYDFLKLHPGLRAGEYRALVAAAQELGIDFAGHVSTDVGLELTLQSRQATIDHLDGYAQELVLPSHALHGVAPAFFGINLADGMRSDRISALSEATMAADVWNVPTQSLFENMLYAQPLETSMARPEMDYVSQELRERWRAGVLSIRADVSPEQAAHYLELRRALLLQLHRDGALLLLGSDAPQMLNVPGFSIHEELGYLVNTGLTPYEALVTGTRNVGRFLDENIGVVAPGYRANMVLLNANPLADIDSTREIRGVMLEGRWLDRQFLDSKLAAIRERKL